jgi:hypothetical protein
MRNKLTRNLGMWALAFALVPVVSSSCTKELDQVPSYTANAENIYRDPVQIQQVLARLYATLAVSGQSGPAGSPDISGIDEGFSNYLRQFWLAQEVTTDEAIIAWNDGNLPDYNKLTWNANNEFVRAMYDRIFYQISLCNEFLRQTTDAKLSARGVAGTEAASIQQYRAEARFLRALSYYHAIDMYGSVPFTDENSEVGGALAKQISRADLFTYVEKELKDVEGAMLAPRAAYGRADQAACWTLLTKLYLNAEVYTGKPRYTDAITYAQKVLGAGYMLASDYKILFMADNGQSAARNEIIFPITFDGTRTKTFGGMPFIVHAAIGGSMPPADFGVNGGWSGNRAKDKLVNLFSTSDSRSMFFTAGQKKEITDIFTFTDGYGVTKFKNVTSTGLPGSDDKSRGGAGDFVDTDFPMFRLADVNLMYAEAVIRGGEGGSATTALDKLNEVRRRAGLSEYAALPAMGEVDKILEERARELYWEGHRRTDLIRFGKYTSGSYVWPFKGGTAAGRGVDDKYKLFPIPATDLVANPNLTPTPGY